MALYSMYGRVHVVSTGVTSFCVRDIKSKYDHFYLLFWEHVGIRMEPKPLLSDEIFIFTRCLYVLFSCRTLFTTMKCVVVLLMSLAAVHVVSAFQYTEEWEAWKKEYGRSYESADIELRRQIIWESNMMFVNEHNAHADEFGFTVEMNEFADLVSKSFF